MTLGRSYVKADLVQSVLGGFSVSYFSSFVSFHSSPVAAEARSMIRFIRLVMSPSLGSTIRIGGSCWYEDEELKCSGFKEIHIIYIM